jgi:hypothetical protein
MAPTEQGRQLGGPMLGCDAPGRHRERRSLLRSPAQKMPKCAAAARTHNRLNKVRGGGKYGGFTGATAPTEQGRQLGGPMLGCDAPGRHRERRSLLPSAAPSCRSARRGHERAHGRNTCEESGGQGHWRPPHPRSEAVGSRNTARAEGMSEGVP